MTDLSSCHLRTETTRPKKGIARTSAQTVVSFGPPGHRGARPIYE